MANLPNVGKKELIDKANRTMVLAIAAAGFLIVFCIFACKALWSQRSYQAEVIGTKEKAVAQLEENQENVKDLAIKYKAFINTPDNIIGGNPSGTGDRDGNNAKIVLDALPSKYDFPAYVTSIEKLLKTKNFSVESIGGSDQEVEELDSDAKDVVEIPFKLSSQVGSPGRIGEFFSTLELSIRPIKLQKVSISGSDKGDTTISVDGTSYYLPAKGLTIERKVLK